MLATLGVLAASNQNTILWVIAAVLVIAGIASIIRGGVLWGIVLILAGLVVGPGGVSWFS
jgi:TM2 domain-containing membrane protein YozV